MQIKQIPYTRDALALFAPFTLAAVRLILEYCVVGSWITCHVSKITERAFSIVPSFASAAIIIASQSLRADSSLTVGFLPFLMEKSIHDFQ